MLERDELEKRIRACYDGFLAIVPDKKDMWKIALLEYYLYPLEAWSENPQSEWELAIPECFKDIAPELFRLTEYKHKVCPNRDCCSVQESLALYYDKQHYGTYFYGKSPELTLPPEAVILLLEYYLLVQVTEDDCGHRYCRELFQEEEDGAASDKKVLKVIVERNIHTPEEQKTLAVQLYEINKQWNLERKLPEEEADWVFEMTEDLLLDAFHSGCAKAGWHLYDILTAKGEWNLLQAADELLREAAEGGSIDAQLEIGACFREAVLEACERRSETCLKAEAAEHIERITGFSGKEAVYWLEQALPYRKEALLYLADIMLKCEGIEVDEERIFRCLSAVAGKEHQEGAGDLSDSIDKASVFLDDFDEED